MKNKTMKILRAWCKEMNAEVTIDEVRQHYTSLADVSKPYNFVCYSPACRDKSIKVIGSGYRELAETTVKKRAACFQCHPKFDHFPGCQWIVSDKVVNKDLDDTAKARNARRKSYDFVTQFDPRPKRGKTLSETNLHEAQNNASNDQEPDKNQIKDISDYSSNGTSRTSNFVKLVQQYSEIQARLIEDEIAKLPFRVIGHHWKSWSEYFQPVENGNHQGVMFGEAKFDGWFGDGFRLQFRNRIGARWIKLYIAPAQMAAYRDKGRIHEAVTRMSIERADAIVYFIGKIEIADKGDTLQARVRSLDYLHLILAEKMQPIGNNIDIGHSGVTQ